MIPNSKDEALELEKDELWTGLKCVEEKVHGFTFSSMNMISNVPLAMKGRISFHLCGDGTYKLAFNGWVLWVIGTCSMEYDTKVAGYVLKFRPFFYMFTKSEKESSIRLCMQSFAATVDMLFHINKTS